MTTELAGQDLCPPSLAADPEQLNLEYQGRVGRNRSLAARTVAEVGRDVEFVFRADAHQLQAFRPTGDHAIDGKCGGFAALVRGVENRAVGQLSLCSGQ